MSLFEFLMVLVSIIIGLGVAEILTGVARQIRERESTQGYWVHSVLVLALFFALLQQWWEIWSLRGVSEWTFLGLIMMLTGPVGLYLIAHLLFPEPMPGANFREYYYGTMRPIWWLGVATTVLATLFRPLIFDQELLTVENASSFVGCIGFAILAISQRVALHSMLVPFFLVLVLIDIFLADFILGST